MLLHNTVFALYMIYILFYFCQKNEYNHYISVYRTLIQLVMQHGERKWAVISEKLEGRAGKQCRERWHNHLRPDIKVFI